MPRVVDIGSEGATDVLFDFATGVEPEVFDGVPAVLVKIQPASGPPTVVAYSPAMARHFAAELRRAASAARTAARRA